MKESTRFLIAGWILVAIANILILSMWAFRNDINGQYISVARRLFGTAGGLGILLVGVLFLIYWRNLRGLGK
jgi:hypothetical protein